MALGPRSNVRRDDGKRPNLSKQNAALRLDVSGRTIDRLRSAGELEWITVGSRVRIPVASLEAYEARQRRPASGTRRPPTRSRSLCSTSSVPARPSSPRSRGEGGISKAPSERELLAVERELEAGKPGDQRAVGGGIYMRLDRSDRRRFQSRSRADGQDGRRHLRQLAGRRRRRRAREAGRAPRARRRIANRPPPRCATGRSTTMRQGMVADASSSSATS